MHMLPTTQEKSYNLLLSLAKAWQKCKIKKCEKVHCTRMICIFPYNIHMLIGDTHENEINLRQIADKIQFTI